MSLRPMFRMLFLVSLLVVSQGCSREAPWNVIMVTVDTTRADHLGCYGKDGAGTPHLDQLAAEGFLFEHATSAVPITLPSHSTIFTGRYPLAHGVRDNGLFVLPQSEVTLAERLNARGYRTGAAIGSFPLTRQFGLDQGFDFYDDHITLNAEDFRGRRQEPAKGVYFDERPSAQVNDAILPWLREGLEKEPDRPFFAWFHYWDPHQPLAPPAPFNQLFLHDLYQGEIAYLDQSLGAVLRFLRSADLYDRTLIVVVGDHGEGRGEHQEESHSMLAYDSTLRVPLILKVPGLEGGRRYAPQVGTVDILSTLLDLLGMEPAENQQGRSLASWIRDSDANLPGTALRNTYYAETLSPRLSHGWGELRVLFKGPFKYIHGPRSELYDLSVDPQELHDLSVDQAMEEAEMKSALAGFIDEHASDSSSSAVQEIDAETQQRLAALGYLSASGDSPAMVHEELRDAGIPPQDRIRDITLMSQAKQHLDAGDFANARQLSQRLIELDPENTFYRGLLATALLGLGMTDEAASVVEKATSLASSNDSVFLAVAQSLFSLGEQQRGLELLQRVLASQDSAYGRYLLAEMMTVLQEPNAAEAEFEAALELDPRFHRAHLSYAVLLAGQGRYAEAEPVFEDLLLRHPLSERGHFNYAVMLLQAKRWDLSLEHLERAIQLRPAYWQARLARLAIFVDRDEVDKATAELRLIEAECRDPQVVRRARHMVATS